MALIDTTLPFSEAQKAAYSIKQHSRRLHGQLMEGHRAIFQQLWKSGADPQEVLDLLHESEAGDAAKLFAAGSLAVQLILMQSPNAIPEEDYLPPRTVTVDENDGSVTLGPEPESP